MDDIAFIGIAPLPHEDTPFLQSTTSDDAIVPGGPPALLSPEAIGLFVQFGAVGFLVVLIPALNYPLFNVYLQMEGYQTASYAVLVQLGWSFKVVFGVLSDCVPLFGYRRKSWMLLGWFVATLGLAAMACKPFGAPYCDRANTSYCRMPRSQLPASELPYFNFHAPDQGTLFILLSMLVCMGYVVAECAADALMIAYGQREPLATRGRLQTTALACRYAASIPASLVSVFGLNGVQYNGSFTFSLAPNTPYAISLVPCVAAACATVCLVAERPSSSSSSSLSTWWAAVWTVLQQQVFWQICAFKFTNSFLRQVGATPLNPIKTFWANVEPATDSLSSMAANALFSLSLVYVCRHGLQWNWRTALVVVNLAIVVLDATAIVATTWAILRNQWFFAALTSAEQIPNGLNMIVGSLCAVELATVGTEGTIYGLLASMVNLGTPLASALFKVVDARVDVSQDAIKADTETVRWHVTLVFVFAYTCKLVALVPLVLWLPPQKAHVQALKRDGIQSPIAGAVVLAVCGISLVFSLVSNVLSVLPATKCFRLAGGSGIVGSDGWCPVVPSSSTRL
ncbi:Aste57867_13152 [Aphanomyces stellatus]|uniref:Aste57867_13152 protein n=1 Tax=Aphanomyces stellatus TaxID=120398 RepID=A0A485KXV0_9STRA|nr:hypothetical protein As57867_013103 [Aphanomyces stellatus]VFT89993.1 Aste57867_13152 [Aphanomyces stellatus]